MVMIDFQEIATCLVNISLNAIDNINNKHEYAKLINYQITPLLQQITLTPNHPSLTPHQIATITRQATTNLTPIDLCSYLHISRQNLKRTYNIQPISEKEVLDLVGLVSRDEQIQEQLKKLLREIDLKRWFSQVDFFNNGYINTTALFQYLLHYEGKQSTFQEYNALLLIKIIKKKDHNDKLFIQDIESFASDQQSIEIDLLSREGDLGLQSNSKIKRKSFDLQSLSSDVSNQDHKMMLKVLENNSMNKSLDDQFHLNSLHYQMIEQQLKKESNLTYQERLIKMHPRNSKYIRQSKKNMEIITPICNIHIQSHLKMQNAKLTSPDIISKIKNIADIFNTIINNIKQFLQIQEKFTFFNAFALLDTQENNVPSIEHWKRYVKELGIKVSQKRMDNFFKIYSRDAVMNFSQYVKIFKYRATEHEYSLCLSRHALIYEKWSEKLLQSYRRFLERIIKWKDEQMALLRDLRSNREQFLQFLSKIEYKQQLKQILSLEYSEYVDEYFPYFNKDTLDGYFQIHIS